MSSSGTVRGTLRDPLGGAIVGASVEISCGGDRRRITSDATGEFVARDLPAVRCTVDAEAPLFEPGRMVVDVTPGVTLPADIVLALRRYTSDVLVTPGRGIEEPAARLPVGVSTVGRDDIDSRPHVLLPQVLREEPGILLQQTTTAQTSPIIRGFTGQSNAYLLDGVRFNTSSWRTGPSQYLGWIDAALADRIEIMRGPGSVQYGSDALGGTINVLSGRPSLSAAGIRVGGDVQAVLGSADTSAGGNATVRVEAPAAAFRVGVSTISVGNLRAGGRIDSHAAVTRFFDLPSTVAHDRMPETGFEQTGAFVVGTVKAGAAASIHALFLHETQTGASRYDRIDGGEGLYRSGFDPQRLDFGLARYQRSKSLGLDQWSATFSFNRQADGRFEQTRPTTVLDSQEAATTALGYQLEGHRRIGAHQVMAGAELYDESISASREQLNPLTGARVSHRPDIPEGTKYASLGVFSQVATELSPDRLWLRAGLRYARYGFSTVTDRRFGVVAERVTSGALTFNASAVVGLTKRLNASFSASRGFRAANAADLGSIGLTGGGGFEITPGRAIELGGLLGTTATAAAVSTGDPIAPLRPESVYAFESGLKFRSSRFGASVNLFDLEYFDAIQRRAIVFGSNVVGTDIAGFQIVRQDANGLAYIAQDVRPVGTRVNVDHARIVGLEVQGDARIGRAWTTRAYFSMSNGRLLGTGEFLRRMPPPLGGLTLKWSGPATWIEGVVTFAGPQRRFNVGDLTDARIGGIRTRNAIATYFTGTATDMGLVRNGVLVATGETLAEVQTRVLGNASTGYLYTAAPGYVVLGARAGWRLSPQIDLIVMGDNLTDRNYRPFGSGVDAPGINIAVRTRYRF